MNYHYRLKACLQRMQNLDPNNAYEDAQLNMAVRDLFCTATPQRLQEILCFIVDCEEALQLPPTYSNYAIKRGLMRNTMLRLQEPIENRLMFARRECFALSPEIRIKLQRVEHDPKFKPKM